MFSFNGISEMTPILILIFLCLLLSMFYLKFCVGLYFLKKDITEKIKKGENIFFIYYVDAYKLEDPFTKGLAVGKVIEYKNDYILYTYKGRTGSKKLSNFVRVFKIVEYETLKGKF